MSGRPTPMETLPRRFWAKVEKTEGCWLWTGAKSDDGYGNISAGRKCYLVAHRVAYELLVGPIPDGAVLDHLCRNRSCVRPDHLDPVTHRTNILRGTGASAGNATKTHCLRGHELAGDNLRVRANGHRVCIECATMRQRAWQTTRQGSGPGRGCHERSRTNCPQGHPYDEANTFVDSRGKRQCRECGRARCRARRAAQSSVTA